MHIGRSDDMYRVRLFGTTFTMNTTIVDKVRDHFYTYRVVIVVASLIVASCLVITIKSSTDDGTDAGGVTGDQHPDTGHPAGKTGDEGTVSEDVQVPQDGDRTNQINTGIQQDAEVTETNVFRPDKLNVLFILADDLRPQFGSYRTSDEEISRNMLLTPNLDSLSQRSLVMRRAYAQYALCGPSRASMLTSRRPDITKIYRNYVNWRESGNFTTIPQYFKDHGYHTIGTGKIFHEDHSQTAHDMMSWSEYHVVETAVDESDMNWMAVDDKYNLDDEQRVHYAKRRLAELAPTARTGEEPFFMAIGFRRPSGPYVCPERFFRQYPLEKGQFLLDQSWQTPRLSAFTKIIGEYKEDQVTRISEQTLKELRRGYMACVSYVDYLVGKLTDAVKELELSASTVIVVTTNNGIHLGENDYYGSYTTHEVAVHIPFIIHVPGRTNQGVSTDALAELIDVFPTLVDAAGLPPIEPCPVRSGGISTCVDGKNMMPLTRYHFHVIKDMAFSQLARGEDLMEVSVRTNKFRYVDFVEYIKPPTSKTKFTYLINWNVSSEHLPSTGRRLYQMDIDPHETNNLIEDPEYAAHVEDLKGALVNKFRSVYDYPQRVYNMYPHGKTG